MAATPHDPPSTAPSGAFGAALVDRPLDALLAWLQGGRPAVLVTVIAARGSVPRRPGAWMAVTPDAVIGTIGGGHLEWDAVAAARDALATRRTGPWEREVALGPSLGQCCGGALRWRGEPVGAADAAALAARLAPSRRPVGLFGGGHVGAAIVRALAPLPFAVHWIDSRDGVFPPALAALATTDHAEPVHRAVDDLPAGSAVLIMSFSHAEDLDIVAACLERRRARDDLPFIGLIGSRTKWATFRRRLGARGFSEAELDGVTCPIGLPGIGGKAPAVIAASVAAQLLMQLPGD